MGRSKGLFAVALWIGLSAGPAAAQRSSGGEPLPEVPPRDTEMEMALGAAPKHLRDEAAVYVLAEYGFVKAREGTNGYSCIVNRDHPRALKPVCYDREGSATILPKTLFVGEQLMQGVPLAEIARQVQEKFDNGEFISPRTAGVAYMLSPHIRNVNPSNGSESGFAPHVMFYAPNLSNADIATSFPARREHPWLPFVAYQGPHGFLVVVVGDLGG